MGTPREREDSPRFSRARAQILAGIEYLVVVVLENRSLDNVLGTLHTDGTAPSVVLPAGSATFFDGLRPDLTNPANPGYFDGGPPQLVPITPSVRSSTVPDPDPEETFTNVTFQIFGPDTPSKKPRGSARRYGLEPSQELAHIRTRQHAVDFFRRRGSLARP